MSESVGFDFVDGSTYGGSRVNSYRVYQDFVVRDGHQLRDGHCIESIRWVDGLMARVTILYA